MSEKINPKIVDGEPMCDGKYCPSHKKLIMGVRFTAYQCEQYEHKGEVLEGDICIPGLRQQRDRAVEMAQDINNDRTDLIIENDQLIAERDEARREICELTMVDTGVYEYAKQRGWDCFEEQRE